MLRKDYSHEYKMKRKFLQSKPVTSRVAHPKAEISAPANTDAMPG